MTFNEQLDPKKSALFSRDIRKRAARDKAAKARREPAVFMDDPPNHKPDHRRGLTDRFALRECDAEIVKARASLDAAKKALAAKRSEWYAKCGPVFDDFDTVGPEMAREEAKRHLEDVEARHEQWLIDSQLGLAEVGPEPPTVEAARAKLAQTKIDKVQARKLVDLHETEVENRERALNEAKRRRADAQAELLRPVLTNLVTQYENKMDELLRIRQIILVVSEATGLPLRLSGTNKQVSDVSTDARNSLVQLGLSADADLSPLLAPLKAPLKNGHAT